MKVQCVSRDLLGAFESATLTGPDGAEYRMVSTGEVERWVSCRITHPGWPGYWRRPSADLVAAARAAVCAAAGDWLEGVLAFASSGGSFGGVSGGG